MLFTRVETIKAASGPAIWVPSGCVSPASPAPQQGHKMSCLRGRWARDGVQMQGLRREMESTTQPDGTDDIGVHVRSSVDGAWDDGIAATGLLRRHDVAHKMQLRWRLGCSA